MPWVIFCSVAIEICRCLLLRDLVIGEVEHVADGFRSQKDDTRFGGTIMPPVRVFLRLHALGTHVVVGFLECRECNGVIAHGQDTFERQRDAEQEQPDDQAVQVNVREKAFPDEMAGEMPRGLAVATTTMSMRLSCELTTALSATIGAETSGFFMNSKFSCGIGFRLPCVKARNKELKTEQFV